MTIPWAANLLESILLEKTWKIHQASKTDRTLRWALKIDDKRGPWHDIDVIVRLMLYLGTESQRSLLRVRVSSTFVSQWVLIGSYHHIVFHTLSIALVFVCRQSSKINMKNFDVLALYAPSLRKLTCIMMWAWWIAGTRVCLVMHFTSYAHLTSCIPKPASRTAKTQPSNISVSIYTCTIDSLFRIYDCLRN